MTIDVTNSKLPEELKTKLENLTPFARKYAEYRAKGLKQADSAQKAGSKASTRDSLTRVGYNTEQQDGVKDYILWLEHKRAKSACIDDVELVDKARDIYNQAMINEKFNDANKALETLCKIAGVFDHSLAKQGALDDSNSSSNKAKSKNNTSVFKEDVEHETPEERLKRIQGLLNKA